MTTLRVAAPDEKAPGPKSVTEAADKGTPRELLVALRARLAKAVEDSKTPPRDLAALSRRLLDVVREIEAIDAEAEDADSSGIEDEAFDAASL